MNQLFTLLSTKVQSLGVPLLLKGIFVMLVIILCMGGYIAYQNQKLEVCQLQNEVVQIKTVSDIKTGTITGVVEQSKKNQTASSTQDKKVSEEKVKIVEKTREIREATPVVPEQSFRYALDDKAFADLERAIMESNKSLVK